MLKELVQYLKTENPSLDVEGLSLQEQYRALVNVFLPIYLLFLIRYPFEQLARQFPDTVTLIRINTHNPEVPNLPNCFSIGSNQLSVVNSQWSKLTANY